MRTICLLCTLCAACASPRAYLPEIRDAWSAEAGGLGLRVVRSGDLDPARARDPDRAMRNTVALAGRYLARERGTGSNRRYVRALLACAYLARGETRLARMALAADQPAQGNLLSRENRVVRAVHYAVGACRGVQARGALEEMFSGRLAVVDFVEEFGSYVGIAIPGPDDPGRKRVLANAVEDLERSCFGPASSAPEARRGDLRRLASEQIYNESAALLVALTPIPADAEPSAVEIWLAAVCANLFVDYAYLIRDMLPVPLNGEQKQWQREQVRPTYAGARKLVERFLSPGEIGTILPQATPRDVTGPGRAYARHLYGRLLDAEIVVLGWISTR